MLRRKSHLHDCSDAPGRRDSPAALHMTRATPATARATDYTRCSARRRRDCAPAPPSLLRLDCSASTALLLYCSACCSSLATELRLCCCSSAAAPLYCSSPLLLRLLLRPLRCQWLRRVPSAQGGPSAALAAGAAGRGFLLGHVNRVGQVNVLSARKGTERWMSKQASGAQGVQALAG